MPACSTETCTSQPPPFFFSRFRHSASFIHTGLIFKLLLLFFFLFWSRHNEYLIQISTVSNVKDLQTSYTKDVTVIFVPVLLLWTQTGRDATMDLNSFFEYCQILQRLNWQMITGVHVLSAQFDATFVSGGWHDICLVSWKADKFRFLHLNASHIFVACLMFQFSTKTQYGHPLNSQLSGYTLIKKAKTPSKL